MSELLAKLKFTSVLQLAFFAPSSYRDLRLTDTIIDGAFQATNARVLQVFNTPKRFVARLFSSNFDEEIEAVFFGAKPWQKAQFLVGSELLLYGKMQTGFGLPQIVQPIKTTRVDGITPIYKTKLQNRVVLDIYKKLLTRENLEKENLPKWAIDQVLEIHFPTDMISHNFDGERLKALKFCEIYWFLKTLSTKRVVNPSQNALMHDPETFIKSLPFKLTADQLKAIDDIKKDLSKNDQAKRLIAGDVGCGKTMVILATAFMVGSGKTLLMAPTTLLANQLYEEANKYLSNHLKITLITQKTKDKNLDLNDIDLIIGTHALLYMELPPAKALIIDEQHRFGTAQRNQLSLLASSGDKKPHFFQFSATPIPRSLAMIQSSLLDISTIKTMPFSKDITTKIIGRDGFRQLLDHINDQLSQNAQVLIVYPHIESSETSNYQSLEEASAFWQKHFESVYITHGKDKEKEAVLLEFREKGKILLATTVIEVGISLPRLNTIVIAGAERLGLATLHQLRGRVGRMGQKSWCFFYTNHPQNERLNELASTLDGFKVAELDLKTRDSGDILSGVVQSGANFVWFDIGSDEELLIRAKSIISKGNFSG